MDSYFFVFSLIVLLYRNGCRGVGLVLNFWLVFKKNRNFFSVCQQFETTLHLFFLNR
jgi:hypothetical protein